MARLEASRVGAEQLARARIEVRKHTVAIEKSLGSLTAGARASR
jgi:hypothetical protein